MIYLDNHATTPVDPRVLRAMLPYFQKKYGNAASGTHSYGIQAAKAVEKGREAVADLIGAGPGEIIFTSGATESNNLAIKGAAEAYKDKGSHIITVLTEHKSVLDPCKRLCFQGFSVTYLSVNKEGLLDLKDLGRSITDKTILISVMLANNEIGTIQPAVEIGRIAKARGVLFHCDAAQAVGKIDVNVKKIGADLLSFTAHKIYGPKGIAALYIRKGEPQVRLVPLFDGGGHERGFRSGTLNVPGIVGFGEACKITKRQLKAESFRLSGMRDRLRNKIVKGLDGICAVSGSEKFRLPNNLNMSFKGVKAEDIIRNLKGIAVSSGSACLSTSPVPSHVLKAIGLSDDLALSSIRFGLGRFNTQKEIDRAADQVIKAVKRLQN